jgi:chitinase
MRPRLAAISVSVLASLWLACSDGGGGEGADDGEAAEDGAGDDSAGVGGDNDDGGGGDGGGGASVGRAIGYYPAWAVYARDYHVPEIPAHLLTHLNYAFVNINEQGECVLGDSYADIDKFYEGDSWDQGALRGNFHQLQLLKEAHPHLKTLLSIGGWTWSSQFSAVAASAEKRARFAASCADMMEQYGFDGLDVDWEYPGGGGLYPGTPEDTENFTLLLADMRAELDARGDYLLTIAAPAGPARIAAIQVDRIHEHLDWINVMTYDFHGTWETTTGFNAPLASAPGDPTPELSVTAALATWLDGGTPPDKLTMGVPFYGRAWAGVQDEQAGLFQPATGAATGTYEAGVLDWHDIAANYLPTMERHFSPEAQVPWLYDADTGVMITYDDPESLTAKVDWVVGNSLGGVMFWELSGDDAESTLLQTVRDRLSR